MKTATQATTEAIAWARAQLPEESETEPKIPLAKIFLCSDKYSYA